MRRDHRYGGYFAPSGGPGVAPTDIQVILAAISGRLGEIGMGVDASPEGEEGLAHEGDTTSAEGDEEREDELEDELLRRRLPVSTRTRMAFDRFSRRYSDALADSGFVEQLGPIPAATNAIIFNHLLARLLERNAISPPVALDSHLVTWAFLWGSAESAGVGEGLDEDTSKVVGELLTEGHAKVETLRGIAAAVDGPASDQDMASLRELTQYLLVDDGFDLDPDLLEDAAGATAMAGGLLDSLARAASPQGPTQILDFVVSSRQVPRGAVHWRTEKVKRAGADYVATTFVVASTMPGLTPALATDMLGRVVAGAFFAGHSGSYWRIRFEGNGTAVAFWDAEAQDGIVMVDGHEEELKSLDVPWPSWMCKVEVLRDELGKHSHTAALA